MPGMINHEESEMSESSVKPGTAPREAEAQIVNGVPVYGRKDDRGRFTLLDAIGEDESAISLIADRLQRSGYGVMRHQQYRAGRTYYICKASWVGRGRPPENPLDPASTTGAMSMKSKLIHEHEGERTFALIFEAGDEAMEGLREFARQNRLAAARFTAIGAFQDVTLGYFDWQSKDYRKIPVREQVEVLSLIGDVAQQDGEPKVHAHVVLGRSDGTTRGGHLLEGYVRPTLEVMLVESPSHLEKKHDPASGLALIRL
jgi:predicted DNA-binding protein with PD1-like motif